MFCFKEINVGDKVRFISKEKHSDAPWCFPPVGTIGTIISVVDDDEYLVQWGHGTTSGTDRWFIKYDEIEKIKEEPAND